MVAGTGAARLLVAQEDVAKRIYTSASDSVVLIYTEKDGKPLGQGSGFVVTGGKVLTNAHVVSAGTPFLMTGPAKVPLKVERIDTRNDLALLSPAVELVAAPLSIQSKDPVPGETVFAIGNPEGLEKTISQGIVSATRDFDGRKLVQITSPVSHGSSGGPVLNKAGEVVGVTVGMLRQGQNLNFAVPASIVTGFMSNPSPTGLAVGDVFSQIDELEAARGDYSPDPDSSWQKADRNIRLVFTKAIESSWSDLSTLKQIAADLRCDSDVAVRAAARVVQLEPSPDNYTELASRQYQAAILADAEKRPALLNAAEESARTGIAKAKLPKPNAYLVLADTLSDEEKFREAQSLYKKVLSAANVSPDQQHSAMIGLIACAEGLKDPTSSEQVFKDMVAKGYATTWDWWYQGKRRFARQSYAEAGAAYETSGQLRTSPAPYGLWCEASRAYVLAGDSDSTLRTARLCIAAAEKAKGTEDELAIAHERIASILADRGVYSEALSHAKESIALKEPNPFAYDDMARTLEALGRTREAINAAQQAIKQSDGKFSWMHFNLGSAYFDAEDWKMAEQSYRKAAELNPKDDAAAYNVAVCLARQQYFGDAASWFEEALRRNPQRKDRETVLQRIRALRAR